MYNAKLTQNPDNLLEFSLSFEGLKPEQTPVLRVRSVDAEKFFMPLYGGITDLPLTVSHSAGTAQVTFSLPRLLNACGVTNLNCRVLEFLLKDDAAEDFVACPDGLDPIRVESGPLAYRLCPGSGGNLVLRLNWQEILVKCEIKAGQDAFTVEVKENQPGELVLRHRIEHDTVRFDGNTLYKAQTPRQYRIPCRDLIGGMTTDSDLYSLYYRIPSREDAPGYCCRVITDQAPVKCKMGDYQLTARKLKNGTASFDCCRVRQQAAISSIKMGSSIVSLSLSDKSAIKLRRIITMPGSRDGEERKFFQEDEAWSFPNGRIPLTTWEKFHQRDTLEFQVIAESEDEEYLVVSEEAVEQTWELAHQTAVLTADPEGCFLRIRERENRIRLGILGTCMTRWAFSRGHTDAYRSLYDVTFAHFWPSVFSLMEEPGVFPGDRYAGYPEKEQKFVRREYEKTSLKELEKARCEYVLVDFFVDAIHGPRRMKDGKFIGYKAYAKDFYQDHLIFDTERYFLDSNGYFEEWKKRADRLISALTRIIPQNRIVLATGGLTHYYLDENGTIQCFDGKTLRGSSMTKHSINGLNYLWDQMNAYFLARLPGAHALHMREYNFPAYDESSANVRPYHFLDEYYRTISAELSRIILWDRQNAY